jgi:hypothetical protein
MSEDHESGRENRNPSTRSLRGVDGINFLMADVRDGVGPYLSVFLKGQEHWRPGRSERGRLSHDDVLVLPRTGAEMSRDTSQSLSGPDRDVKDIMSANNLSLETVRGLHENAPKYRRNGNMKRE